MLNSVVATALVIVALMFSACSGDEGGTDEPPSTSTPVVTRSIPKADESYWVLSSTILLESVKHPEPPAAPPAAPVVEYVEPVVVYYTSGVEQWRGLVGKYDWDVNLMLTLISRESGGNPNAVSPTNDWGLCQVNWPSHYDKVQRMFGVADPNLLLIPANNIAICYEIFRAAGRTYTPWATYY